MNNKKLIEELKKQLELIKYDRNKILSEQNIISEIGPGGEGDLSFAGGQNSREYKTAMGYAKENNLSNYQKLINQLNNNPTPYNLAKSLIESLYYTDDNEKLGQYAFSKIKNEFQYYEVGFELRDDPYLYITEGGLDSTDLVGNGINGKEDYWKTNTPTINNKWKSLGSPNFPYGLLKKYPLPENITKVLKKCSGFGDREAWAQAAIYAIKNKEDYYKVTRLLNMDPILYCEKQIGMDLNTDYLTNEWNNWPSIEGWLPDIGKPSKGDLGYKQTEIGAVQYPFGVLSSKEVSVPLLSKVFDESFGNFTSDKPEWVQFAFNAMIDKVSKDNYASVYYQICKELGRDLYATLQYFLSDEGGLNENYLKDPKFKNFSKRTIQQCYDIIKQNSTGLSMYYDFTIGSSAMFEMLKSKKASPKYVSDLLLKSIGYMNTGAKLGDTAAKTTLGYELFSNDLEDVIVACFIAIPDKVFFDQVSELSKNIAKDGIYKYISEYVDTEEIYFNTSVNKEMFRINKTAPKQKIEDSREVIQETIKTMQERGFPTTNFDDCITSGQVIYKAYIYGLKEIMSGIESRRKKDYRNLSESKHNNKSLLNELVPIGPIGSDIANSFMVSTIQNIGYPNCLNISCIQFNSGQSEPQRMEEKIKITIGNFGVNDNIAEEAYDNLTSYMSEKDMEYIVKNDPNSSNLNLENTYLLSDFVNNWSGIETQYNLHFKRESKKECELFPQGPDEFFKYWFGTYNFQEALSLSEVPPPKIYCQNQSLRTDQTLKEGFDLFLEQVSETYHMAAPILSMALSIFGNWPGAIIGAILEIGDAALYLKEGDKYLAGLSLVFALIGPLDMKIGELISKSKGIDNFLKELSVTLKMKKTLSNNPTEWEAWIAKSDFYENFIQISTLIRKNKLKYSRLAKVGLFVRSFERLWIAASKEGGKGYIKVIAWLANAGLVSSHLISKITLIIGGGFLTWDFIASLAGVENTMPLESAAKYNQDSPEAHYWITNLFISLVKNLQPFSDTPIKIEGKKPTLAYVQSVKKAIKNKIDSDLNQIIEGKKILKVGSEGVDVTRIQVILEILGMNKDFSSFSTDFNRSFENLTTTNIETKRSYEMAWAEHMLDKNLYGSTEGGSSSKKCSYMMGGLQYYPSEKNKLNPPFKTIIYFNEEDKPNVGVFKNGDEIRIENTNFNGPYIIDEVHQKNDKIIGVTLKIRYKSNINVTNLSDNTFKGRGVIKKTKGCFYSLTPKPFIFEKMKFNEDMKTAVLNYQIHSDIPQTGIIDSATAKKLKESLQKNLPTFEDLLNTEEGKELWFTTKEQDDKIYKEWSKMAGLISGIPTGEDIDKLYKEAESLLGGTKGLESAIKDTKNDYIFENPLEKIIKNYKSDKFQGNNILNKQDFVDTVNYLDKR